MGLEVCSGRKILISNDIKYNECFCASAQASVCWLLDGFHVLVAPRAAASEAVAVPQ